MIRRRFLTYFAGTGVGATLLPGVLWAQVQASGSAQVTKEMLKGAITVAGLDLSEEDQQVIMEGVNQNLSRYDDLRKITIPNDVPPALYFNALVPGMQVNRTSAPLRFSHSRVKRPQRLEDVAYWTVLDLAQLIRSRQVASVELTQMYIARLKDQGREEKLNCLVTLLEDHGIAEARRADAEIKAGKYRGPLHGIPWGIKDLFTLKGHPTTWGCELYKDQIFDYDATVIERLREAGAVLIAKLSTTELAAGGATWYRGTTKNPWNLKEDSGGSSGGPAAAATAGLVGFAIGTETSGSIIGPSSRCGTTGLRPTFGRSSRYGGMVLSWSQDRVGPFCRSVEDCAVVMSAIAGPDGRDLTVADLPFNWDHRRDARKLRIGYIKQAFDEAKDPAARQRNDLLLQQVRGLGSEPIEVKVPDFTSDVSAIDPESATFFDGLIRAGRSKDLAVEARRNRLRQARVVPAVEYLRSQRVRTLMMMELAKATEHVDVWFAPANPGNTGGGGGGGGAPSASSRHSSMANLATYPALAMPFGLNEVGSPMAIVFFARPFGETELLTFGKAFQDATGFHLKHPPMA
jgi:Asp-tRNA(Asn)/Glu-tRNA(Gln) amidotransferase A subunit family amidase